MHLKMTDSVIPAENSSSPPSPPSGDQGVVSYNECGRFPTRPYFRTKRGLAYGFELVHLGWSGACGCHATPGCTYGSALASDSGGGPRSSAWDCLDVDTGSA